MNNRYRSFSRKQRQLNYVLKQISQLKTSGKNVSVKLVQKLRRIAKAMEPRIGRKRVAQLIGGAALLMATSASVQAQTLPVLAPGVQNTFGIAGTPENDYSIPTFADLDGDGDLDFLTTEYEYISEYEYSTNWVYQENTGTADAPAFGPVQTNPFGLTGDLYIQYFTLADLDGDGDQDVLAAYFDYDQNENGPGVLLYIENIGSDQVPAFATAVEAPFGLQPTEFDPDNLLIPIPGDLDNDGDIDLIIQHFDGRDPYSFGNNNFYYHENQSVGGTISFAEQVANPFGGNLNHDQGFEFTSYIALVDIDQDGDLDLTGGGVDLINELPILAYAPNNGTPETAAFGAREVDPFEYDFGTANTEDLQLIPGFTDIDNDGDLDMFASDADGNLVFFENVTTSSVSQQEADFALTISPNPTADILSITTEEAVQRIEVSNLLGHQLITATSNLQRLDLSTLPTGIYLVKVITDDNRFSVRKIRKQ